MAINVVEGGKSPEAGTFEEMRRIGIARVSLPATLMRNWLPSRACVTRADGTAAPTATRWWPWARLADFPRAARAGWIQGGVRAGAARYLAGPAASRHRTR
ncbi:hypothetical protein ACU4GD_31445 [Cupriavidus basilensis]